MRCRLEMSSAVQRSTAEESKL